MHASATPGVDPHASMAGNPEMTNTTAHMSIMPSDEINKAPTANEFEKLMKQYAAFKDEDPSPYYDIVGSGKIGVGGFAKVYKAKRKEDGKICALKLCEPKSDEDWQLMFNEVGLMNLCKGQNDSVLEVIDSYTYADRLWIFVELMSTALT